MRVEILIQFEDGTDDLFVRESVKNYTVAVRDGEAEHPPYHAQMCEYIRRNRKVNAIKLVREHTGWGLKEAKAYVDDVAYKMG